MKKLKLSLSLLLLSQLAFAQKTDSVIKHQELNKIAAAITPAVQIAYLNNGKVEHYNYGVKEVSQASPINNETIFQAASLSKIVATYAFLILADKGLIDLDKPLWSYVQYNRLRNDPNRELMTGRHVLTHQTGLVNWHGSAGSKAWKENELNTKFTPGTNYTYSGEAYYYLQLVAEKVTGKSLNDICKQYIFEPFGMKQSSFVYNDSFEDNISIGHAKLESKQKIQKFSQGNSAYTLYTTADEYMKFLIEAVLNGKGLSKKMHKDFLTPRLATVMKGKETERDEHIKCCLGIRTQENETGLAYWHTGSNGGGYRCVFLIYPDTKKGAVILTNSTAGWDVNLPIFNKLFGADQTYWLLKK